MGREEGAGNDFEDRTWWQTVEKQCKANIAPTNEGHLRCTHACHLCPTSTPPET